MTSIHKKFILNVFNKKWAVALRVKYTKYSDNLMINLLYLVVLFLIAQPL